MTGIFGIFGDASLPELPSATENRAREGKGCRVTATWQGFVAAQPGIAPVAVVTESEITVVALGLPASGRGVSSPGSDIERHARDFLRQYRARGAAAADSIVGPYCIVAADTANRRLVVAVDRMGIQQAFFARKGSAIAFATSVDLLAQATANAPDISAQALFDYVYFHVIPSPVSIFEGVTRLGPGECVVWEHGDISHSRYWLPHFDEHTDRPFAQLRRDFLDALEAAVKDATSGSRSGAFLSGGTDSSTLAGLIGRCSGAPADTYSIGFAAEGYDEMRYARTAAKHFNTHHHEYYVTPDDVVASIPLLAAIHDQPFGNSSAVPTYYCAKLAAADGVGLMIAGDGGDELFGGNARYATQHVLSWYEKIPPLLRRTSIEPAARRLPTSIAPLRKIRSYVEQASIPMPARTETYNFLHRLGLRAVFSDRMLDRVDVDQPLRLQSLAYFNPSASTLINRQLALDMKFTLADNDLRKVVRSCELAGLPVAFPMLDRRVVEFSLALAPRLKLRGTKLRYFFKEALRDFLPEAILRKQKHGFGLPFGPWMVSHDGLRRFALDSVADLESRGIFQPQLLKRLPDQLREHPAYYGTLIWVLMMLEQWLKRHAPATHIS